MKYVNLQVEITEDQAEALAQFCKRIKFSDITPLAKDFDEADLMWTALIRIGKELANIGFEPR